MSLSSPSLPEEFVKWVRKVNGRWLVHHDLSVTTVAYLDHLAQDDPARLEKVCRIAHELVHEGGFADDPKPRFYGGVFSLCTPEEQERFLSTHLFTALLLPHVDEKQLQSGAIAAKLSAATFGKVQKIRAQIKEKIGVS